jgi:hypothetical protein
MALNHRIIQTISRQAYDEIGNALGIRHDGVLVLDSEDLTSVMSSADMPRRIQCILTRATCCGHTGAGSRGNSISPLKSPCEVMLPIARACLAIGAAGYITDENTEANSRKPRVSPAGPASKWRRR